MPKIDPRRIVIHSLDAETDGSHIPISVFADVPYVRTLDKPMILIIYGGGEKFIQDELSPIKTAFLERGYMAAGFNFRGHIPNNHRGFFDTGLCTRIEDARAVLERLSGSYPYSPISVFAVSMGSYVASFLEPEKVRNLILVGPAAYHPDAVQKRLLFGPEFKALITQERSWINSDGFQNIRNFGGSNLLVIQFGLDKVIPPEIPGLYLRNHPGPKKKLSYLNFPHEGNFTNERKVRLLVAASTSWIRSNP